jgi:SAM-dependent methyltransferase/acyl carrier protein
MFDWLDATVTRIRSFAPRRILEIGCGAGLLLSRLVGECERYVATDISREVIARLSANLPLLGADARKVELCDAAETERALGARRFDCIIVNSVIHYFPHEAYLRARLAQLVGQLEPGGVLFVGDVRHLGWNERFHADVERVQAAPGADPAAFESRVRARLQNEKELVVAPELFLDVARALGTVSRVELLPKLGRHANEMNLYRYDAVLQRARDSLPVPAARAPEIAWSTLGSLTTLEAVLRDGALDAQGALIVRDVLNARLTGGGVDPAAWATLARAHGAEAELALGTGESTFGYHVMLRRMPASDALTRQLYPLQPGPGPFCNSPLLKRARRAIESALRAHLRERLPPYMQPAAFVLLDAFPVTSNGKVDRDALPAPAPVIAADAPTDSQPLSATQSRLRALWTRLLGETDIAAADNFHALGGDSLSAVRLLDAIQGEFAVGLDFNEVQQAPTLAGLAERIELALAQRTLLANAQAGAGAVQGAREVLRL